MATETPPRPPAGSPSPSGGRGLSGALTKKYGPLPLYAWSGLVIVGYLLWRHFRSGSGALGGTAANSGGTGAGTFVPTGDQSGGGTGEAGSSGVGTQNLTPTATTQEQSASNPGPQSFPIQTEPTGASNLLRLIPPNTVVPTTSQALAGIRAAAGGWPVVAPMVTPPHHGHQPPQ